MVRLIDADALKQRIAFRMWDVDDDCPHDEGTIRINEDWAIDALVDKQPTIEAVPVVHGKWIPTHESGMFSHPYSITYVCSECGYSFYTLAGMPPKTKYCPECGAKMDEVSDD